jgi:hypothetical protein
VLSLPGVKYFAWDDAKNAKLRRERGAYRCRPRCASADAHDLRFRASRR